MGHHTPSVNGSGRVVGLLVVARRERLVDRSVEIWLHFSLRDRPQDEQSALQVWPGQVQALLFFLLHLLRQRGHRMRARGTHIDTRLAVVAELVVKSSVTTSPKWAFQTPNRGAPSGVAKSVQAIVSHVIRSYKYFH